MAPPPMTPSYTELHCLSNFSFLRGASHPEELVERALALEYSGLALTDECSFAGSVRAHLALTEAREQDEPARAFRLIHGTEIQLATARAMIRSACDPAPSLCCWPPRAPATAT
jgi:error-prone DNA polymerase